MVAMIERAGYPQSLTLVRGAGLPDELAARLREWRGLSRPAEDVFF